MSLTDLPFEMKSSFMATILKLVLGLVYAKYTSLSQESEIHVPVQGTSNYRAEVRAKSLAADLPVLVQPTVRRQI